jgi:hypothetical protein
MAKTKYQEYYQQMLAAQAGLFTEFQAISKEFAKDALTHEAEFHRIGQKVLDVIREYDRRLCSAMGRGSFSQYSQQLSEKFWKLVRDNFPQIDLVGVKVSKKDVE